MSIEAVTSEKVSEEALKLRRHMPDYEWLPGEFENAIFETFVINLELPWNHEGGYPDWKDPKIKELRRHVGELLYSNEKIVVENILAKCLSKDCDWSTVADGKFVKATHGLVECNLTYECGEHHIRTGRHTQHNRFSLHLNDKEIGLAAVSSQVCTGYIENI